MFRTGKSTKTESRVVGCQGLEGENQGEWLLIGMRFLRGVMKMFWSRQWWWKQSLARAPGPADLYTSEGWMSRHADYISIKLLLKKNKSSSTKGKIMLDLSLWNSFSWEPCSGTLHSRSQRDSSWCSEGGWPSTRGAFRWRNDSSSIC